MLTAEVTLLELVLKRYILKKMRKLSSYILYIHANTDDSDPIVESGRLSSNTQLRFSVCKLVLIML